MLGWGSGALWLNHRFGLGRIWVSGPTVGTGHREEDSEISVAVPPGEQGNETLSEAMAWWSPFCGQQGGIEGF